MSIHFLLTRSKKSQPQGHLKNHIFCAGPPIFDGTLGDWNRPPISIELKEGAKPYHGRPYPVAQVHKATLIKEINRLCSMSIEEAGII